MVKTPFKTQLRLAGTAARQDLMRDWRYGFCLVFALAAVLTPLLILFGLRFGIVEELRTRLLDDPRNLEITVRGNGKYGPDWFAELAEREDIGFMMPKTRSIAASVFVRRGGEKGARKAVQAELIPTSQTDPLLLNGEVPAPALDEVVITERLGADLKLAAGDAVEIIVSRTIDGRRETVRREIPIAGVLPARLFQRPALFLPLAALIATEDYRDGYGVGSYDWPGAERPRDENGRTFASFRIYANDLDAVPGLHDFLKSKNVVVESAQVRIEEVRALDRNLTTAFHIVALFGGVGFLLALAGSLWANVERKRADLSVLRLLGWQSAGLVAFPVIQALIIGAGGALIACLGFLGGQSVINTVFADALAGAKHDLCRLLPEHFAAAIGVTLLVAFIASIWSGLYAARIPPIDDSRKV